MREPNVHAPSRTAETAAAHARYLGTAELPGLHGLRALAIVPVIWHHATPRPLPGLLGKGPVGVDLFFALSGFLITTLLVRERRRTGQISLTKFYARRSLRIFPLYYLVLAGYAAQAFTLGPGSAMAQHFWRSLPFHATFTANWWVDYAVAHPVMFAFSWSLCVEEQFYWVWPVLLALGARLGILRLAILAAILLDSLAEQGALEAVLPVGSLGLRMLTSFAAPIGFGAWLALVLDTPRGFGLVSGVLGRPLVAPLLLLVSVGLLSLPTTPYAALSLCLACLVGAVTLTPQAAFTRWLERPALRAIGAYSYAAYLLHVTALGLVRHALPTLREQALLVFALGLPLTLLLAAAAHRLIERPLLALRARFRA
jgi:peptidoglycan/LPS O-acetylase OafA/YrhL